MARRGPKNRPMKTLLAPQRSKKLIPRSSSSGCSKRPNIRKQRSKFLAQPERDRITKHGTYNSSYYRQKGIEDTDLDQRPGGNEDNRMLPEIAG